MVRLTGTDHITPPIVIVHAPRRDMQAEQAVKGCGDAHQLLGGLAVDVHRALIGSCGRSIGLPEMVALQPSHCVQGHLDLA